MKTTLLFLLSFLVLFQLHAQENFDIPTIEREPEVNIAAENRMLLRRLLLNEAQFKQVEEINTERNQALRKVAQMYQFDPENRKKKMEEMELQYDAEFELILTKQQYSDYLAMHGRNQQPEPEKTELANDETKPEIDPDEPTFNDRIQAILEKATAPKIDSALIAHQDTTDFEPLTMEEQLILDGLMPPNATLIAIRADSAKKNTGTIAAAEVKPTDGECKTCYAINPEDSSMQQSNFIALKKNKKTEEPEIIQENKPEKIANVNKPELWDLDAPNNKPENTNETESEAVAPAEKKTDLAVEEEVTPLGSAPKNENALVISAEEVKKLREAMGNNSKNGTVLEEETGSSETDPELPTETLPLHKSLAEQIEP